jgi:hypothetical protein
MDEDSVADGLTQKQIESFRLKGEHVALPLQHRHLHSVQMFPEVLYSPTVDANWPPDVSLPPITLDNAENWLSSEAYHLFGKCDFTFEPLNCDKIPSGMLKAYRQLVSLRHLYFMFNFFFV